MFAYRAAFLSLIVKPEFLTCESKRVGLDVLLFSLRQTSDDGRVNATAQEDANRHIADQLALYRGSEALAN